MMCDVLEILGLETAVAFSGPECLGVAALFDPHLTFMDFDMPGMDGCKALAQVRLLVEPLTAGRALTAISFGGRTL